MLPNRSTVRTTISRRALLVASGAGLVVASLGGFAALFPRDALAQRAKGPSEVPVDELMKAGDLPDLVQGNPDAKITIVEYASLTCSHCASFHNKVFGELKAKYIDTGKVRFILREFPLDNLAAAAAMLTRCVGADKASPLASELFKRQDDWAFVRGNPVPKLFEMAKQAGFTQETFDKCLTDQKLLDQVTAVRTRASEKFGVSSTPTFFIDGKRVDGPTDTIATFDKALEPLLKS